jgi:hypothetical protein
MPIFEAKSFIHAKELLSVSSVKKIQLHFDVGCDQFFELATLSGPDFTVVKLNNDLVIIKDKRQNIVS